MDLNNIRQKWNGSETFKLACGKGHSKMVEFFMEKAAILKIDLPPQNWNGNEAFRKACEKNHTNLAEIFLRNSVELNIEINPLNCRLVECDFPELGHVVNKEF